jgi:hypothetical protein
VLVAVVALGLCRAHTGRFPHWLTTSPGRMSVVVKDVANLHSESTGDADQRGHRRIRAAVFNVHQVLGTEPSLLRRLLLAELLFVTKSPDAFPQTFEHLDGFPVRPGFRAPLRAGLLREPGHELEQAPNTD